MSTVLPLLAVLSGLCFTAIGVAYRLGQERGITPLQILFWASLVGIVFFGARTPIESWTTAPRVVWIWAILGGFSQYLGLHLTAKALRLGPLSPYWCATNLTFLITALVAAFFWDESITLLQSLGLASGIGAVLAGVWSVTPTTGINRQTTPASWGQRMDYASTLCLLMLINSLMPIAIKALSREALPSGEDALSQFSGVFTTTMYVSLWLGMAVDMILRGAWRRPDLRLIGLAALAGGGSVGGFLLWCLCAKLSAAVLFTLSCIASIVGAGLVSVILFREKASAFWFLMMGLAVLTILLLNGK
ncbi:MAG: EamA family transporter [Verrucomicrobia bacterium]|nr:EamA family transporter [Verrucomicrobiota bacterium]MCG2679352.1 EamA family transporter [Kiritimatiellia bacterium]MBU4248559.1 EamA family transporter [Verrucomicrobiota bacterium]MBU4291929.1 EamA family transporter [Verrucomicrobiota bacterium]MBU4430038.1 EamA family transporter [Verrucomicrobiota bacterium]